MGGNRKVIIIGAILVAPVLLGAYWLTRGESPPHYQTTAVTRGNIQHAVTASGTVNPVTIIQVGTYVSGVIQKLYCDFNSQVKAGTLCAKIDSRPYQALVDQESAALGTARAQRRKDQANLNFSKVIYDRDVELLHRRIVSQETVDAALDAYNQAQAQVSLDESNIAQRLASLETAKVNLGYTNIVSPVDGTVVSRNVTQGQTVAASFQTPTLFLIATDLTQMQVDTNVSESDIGHVAAGEKAIFTVEAYPETSFSGTVVQVRRAPQSIQNVITYDAVVGVPNPQLLLMPGMTAAVRIVTEERWNVLRVPDQALRYVPAKSDRGVRDLQKAAVTKDLSAGAGRTRQASGIVWRLMNGKPVSTPLEIGLDDGAYTEVLAGTLAVGDEIIVGENGSASDASAPRLPRM